ncbi:hypothetical protein ACFE04_030346 [Oxalis oulophora]
MPRSIVKRERERDDEVEATPNNTNTTNRLDDDHNNDSNQRVNDRRALRSKYLSVKNTILGEKDGIASVDSKKFRSIFNKVETLHQQVKKPREQVADAEALLDITTFLVTSIREQNSEGISISDFVSCIFRDFGQHGGSISSHAQVNNSINWKNIGVAVSDSFRSSSGCRTMIGPMDLEIKQRKAYVRRKRTLTTKASPEVLHESGTGKTDTDKNMVTMFDVLRKNKGTQLENLVLNRNSFAQTLENVFALSFLVKDGRAEIKIDDKGCHRVSPRDAPSGKSIASGEVTYNHFVFRFDFSDWKLMTESVEIGKELMPHRNSKQEVPNRGESEAPDLQKMLRSLCL